MMTFEEWCTCDEAWWVYKGDDRALYAHFIEPPRSNNISTMTRCDDHGNRWGYCVDLGMGHWFATKDEAHFYIEVLS